MVLSNVLTICTALSGARSLSCGESWRYPEGPIFCVFAFFLEMRVVQLSCRRRNLSLLGLVQLSDVRRCAHVVDSAASRGKPLRSLNIRHEES